MPLSFSVRLHNPIEFTRARQRMAGRRLRLRCAKLIDLICEPESMAQGMMGPPLVDRRTVMLVAPELSRARQVLLAKNLDVPVTQVRWLADFLTNGRTSALFDRSPSEARQHARGLVERLIDAAEIRA